MALMRHNRLMLADALSNEIKNLAEDTENDDEEFDKLLANIDTLMQGYRL